MTFGVWDYILLRFKKSKEEDFKIIQNHKINSIQNDLTLIKMGMNKIFKAIKELGEKNG